MFRTLARDGGVSPWSRWPTTSSALADAAARHRALVLAAAPENPPPRRARHGHHAPTASSAAKELGYGATWTSSSCTTTTIPMPSAIYATLVRKMINWLTVRTGEKATCTKSTPPCAQRQFRAAGHHLRGLCQLPAGRGSNTAWMLGAPGHHPRRFVLARLSWPPGSDAVRQSVITAPRDLAGLVPGNHRHAPEGCARPTLCGPGNLTETQVPAAWSMPNLRCGGVGSQVQRPRIVRTTGNISLLERAEAAAPQPEGWGHAAAQAYRRLRQIQHRAAGRSPTQVEPDTVAATAPPSCVSGTMCWLPERMRRCGRGPKAWLSSGAAAVASMLVWWAGDAWAWELHLAGHPGSSRPWTLWTTVIHIHAIRIFIGTSWPLAHWPPLPGWMRPYAECLATAWSTNSLAVGHALVPLPLMPGPAWRGWWLH